MHVTKSSRPDDECQPAWHPAKNARFLASLTSNDPERESFRHCVVLLGTHLWVSAGEEHAGIATCKEVCNLGHIVDDLLVVSSEVRVQGQELPRRARVVVWNAGSLESRA